MAKSALQIYQEKILALNHMNGMIEENRTKIAEGDDVFGRKRIVPILKQQIIDGIAELDTLGADAGLDATTINTDKGKIVIPDISFID